MMRLEKEGSGVQIKETKDFIAAVEAFEPQSQRESIEKDIICRFIKDNAADVLTRSNAIAHMTSSAMVFNEDMTRVLMAWHNIYQSWAWTGGHADGDGDLMAVAVREAQEETGITGLRPITEQMISLDILTVQAHEKHGVPVNAHLHLSACYAFVADETVPLRVKPDENSRVGWIPVDALEAYVSEPDMLPIYHKIISRSRDVRNATALRSDAAAELGQAAADV